MNTTWIMRASLVGFGAFGCASTSSVGTTTTTSATVGGVPVEQAVRQMSSVRCLRELACGNVGESAMEGCRVDARNATRAMFANQSCTSVVSAKLVTCLEDTRNEQCGPADGTSERMSSCRDMKLCL